MKYFSKTANNYTINEKSQFRNYIIGIIVLTQVQDLIACLEPVPILSTNTSYCRGIK